MDGFLTLWSTTGASKANEEANNVLKFEIKNVQRNATKAKNHLHTLASHFADFLNFVILFFMKFDAER